MCSDKISRVAADGHLVLTAHDSAFGVPGFCALLSQLKSTTAYAAGVKARRAAYLKRYSASERGKEVMRAYERRNRAKRNAYNKMRRAMMYGDLVKPDRCETCGSIGRVDGHHDDYAQPLVVRWLCRPCHKTWHRKNGKAKNG